jgi:hypothetical protein
MGVTAMRKGIAYRRAASLLTTPARPTNAEIAPMIAATFSKWRAFVGCLRSNFILAMKLISSTKTTIAYSALVPPYRLG